jgi:hypothetical protein
MMCHLLFCSQSLVHFFVSNRITLYYFYICSKFLRFEFSISMSINVHVCICVSVCVCVCVCVCVRERERERNKNISLYVCKSQADSLEKPQFLT